MWEPPDVASYSHLLGLYLGDGWIWATARTYGLRLALDARYPDIVASAAASVTSTGLPRTVSVRPKRGSDSVVVTAYSSRWPEAFPQHGPGRKHDRTIALADWQEQIVDAHPGAFIRGLLESDGCRCVNRFSTTLPSGRVATYAYPRYFFSNESEDIRRLFCDACDRLGIRWTQSNRRNISIARRADVARLDELAGPVRDGYLSSPETTSLTLSAAPSTASLTEPTARSTLPSFFRSSLSVRSPAASLRRPFVSSVLMVHLCPSRRTDEPRAVRR